MPFDEFFLRSINSCAKKAFHCVRPKSPKLMKLIPRLGIPALMNGPTYEFFCNPRNRAERDIGRHVSEQLGPIRRPKPEKRKAY